MNHNPNDKFARARDLFPHTKNVVYFNSASYGPFSTVLREAVEKNLDIRVAADHDDSHESFEVRAALRKDYAELIGAKPEDVGLGLNTTFGLNVAAFGLPLKEGDEVLVSDVEFPAVVYTFRAAAASRGLKLSFVKSKDRRFDIDAFERVITDKTRVLALSYVQYFNGYKNDLASISEICRQHNIYFVVDGIQGMGVEPIDVRALDIDIFTSGCQKWMLSPQGCGFFYLSDQVRSKLKFPFMSWLGVDWKLDFTDLFRYDRPFFDSAEAFEMGYYAVLNLLGMKASSDLFKDLGIPDIQAHNHHLIDRLADYVRSNPYYKIESSMEPIHRSSIFSFSCPDDKELHRELLNNKIILVRREGAIRVSVHLFNNEQDIDKLIGILDRFAKAKS
ncbi:MAG TPA: aminotransferase class V-fold PLP-dependent enzyme [candidate division Zixibacteria bacterium]|nr:aminotransferase class V-fold PLP-dependent enzyme [candidate division Zixibacteria bacterium]